MSVTVDEGLSPSPISPTSPPPFLWRDGQIDAWSDAQVHINAVGHASVSAVFEGIRAYRGDNGGLLVFRLREHMERLLQSARLCRLDVAFKADALEEAVCSLLRRNAFEGDVYIRPWIFPAGIIREQIAPAGLPATVVIDSWTVGSRLATLAPCSACVSSWHRAGSNAFPSMVKAFSNYHNSRLASLEAWHNGYDWPILLNDRGLVSEGPGACLGLIRNGTLITPDLSSGILDSITRKTVLHLARQDLGLEVVERAVDRAELSLADEVFFMGTGWEILPISRIDGLSVGKEAIGPITRDIAALYHACVRGRTLHTDAWCRRV